LEKYNKQNPDNAVKFEDVQIGSVELSNLKSFWGNNKGCVILDLYGDHTGNVVVKNNNSNWSAVTGVFSKTGGSGTVDIDHTRNWLSKVLGIDKGNVVVTNAVMRSASNEPVYAFTNVILDRLTDEFEGIVKISTRSDYGVEYHEAWHYVNLLLHDEQERIALWKAYLNTHKYLKRKGVTWGDIEEAMADDFKLFMEGFENTSIKGKVSTFFNNVFNFLFATRDKRAYRRVFKQIAKGAYASIKIDEKSAKEFIEGYNKYGVFKINHAMPNISKEELQNLK